MLLKVDGNIAKRPLCGGFFLSSYSTDPLLPSADPLTHSLETLIGSSRGYLHLISSTFRSSEKRAEGVDWDHSASQEWVRTHNKTLALCFSWTFSWLTAERTSGGWGQEELERCVTDGQGRMEREGELSVMLSVPGARSDKRRAAWQCLLSFCGREGLLCSPPPPMSDHSAGVLSRGAGLYGCHLSTVFWSRGLTEAAQMVGPGENTETGRRVCCSCGSSSMDPVRFQCNGAFTASNAGTHGFFLRLIIWHMLARRWVSF